MQNYMISYDISDDTNRRNIVKILEKAHGMRVQRSVFFIKCTHKKIHDLEARLIKYIEDKDSLLVLPCCQICYVSARMAKNDPQPCEAAVI